MASTRQTLFRSLALVAGCILALAIAEVVLSLRSRPREEVPQRQQAAVSAYQHAPFACAFASRTVDMHAAMEAFSFEPDTATRVNSQGFRSFEYTIARPPDTLRIAVIGDSLTWGQGVALEETFALQLDALLDERLAAAGIRAEVIPLGTCGSRLVDNVIRLLAHAQHLDPDIVVIQYYNNDLEFRENYRQRGLLELAGEHSSVAQAVRRMLDGMNYWQRLRRVYDPSTLDWRLFCDATDELRQWSESSGVPVVFLRFPPLDMTRSGKNFDRYTKLAEHADLLARPLGQISKASLPIVDLVEPLAREAGEQFLCVSEQDGHPNQLAHAIAARALLAFLDDQGRLPASDEGLEPAHPAWQAEDRLRREAGARWEELNRDYRPQLALFEALLALHPDNPWLIAQCAQVNQRCGQLERASELYQSLTRVAPDIAAPWYHMATCTSDADEQQRLLARMLEAIPDHSPSIEDLMNIHAGWKRDELACRYAAELGAVARYPEQFARALEFFEASSCERFGLDFWG